MTTHPDPLAAAWLDRVDRLAGALPPDERAELLADLREHLDAALPDRPDPDQVRAVLARLGDPADVVAAAVDDGRPVVVPGPPPPPRAVPPGTTTAERLTLAALVLSGLLLVVWPLAVVLWLAGLVGLLTATRWRGGEIGVALSVPVVLGLLGLSPFVVFVAGATTCTSVDGGAEVCAGGAPGWVAVVALVGLVLLLTGCVFAVRWLARRVDGRPAA